MHTDEYCDTSSVELLYLEKEFSLWETDSIQRGRLSISAVGGAGLNRPVLERRCRIKKKKKTHSTDKKNCVCLLLKWRKSVLLNSDILNQKTVSKVTFSDRYHNETSSVDYWHEDNYFPLQVPEYLMFKYANDEN